MPGTAAASLGVQALFGVGTANPVTQAVELGPGGDKLQAKRSRVETNGLRGTRQRIHETTGDGPITVSGDVEIIPTNTVLGIILPWIMGGARTGASQPYTYPYAETLPTFYVTSDRKAKVFTYTGCKINKAVFSFQQSGQLKLVLSIVGQTETVGNSGTFPSLTMPTDPPFMWSGAVYTFNSIARSVKDSQITIDNGLITDRFNNSQTLTQIPEGDSRILVACTNPFTSEETDLYNVALGSDAAGTITATDGTHTLTFSFAKLDWPAETPTIDGRQEIMTKLNFTSRKASTTDALSITL